MWGEATWEYLHLLVVPFPLALSLSAALVGVVGWALGRESLERWSVLALVLAGVMAPVAYVTGLSAADVASARTFVEPSLVQTHRTWATWTVVLLVAQAVFGAFSLLQPDDERLRRFVVLVGVVAAGLVAWAGFLGGKIVHGPATDVERIEETVDADRDSTEDAPVRNRAFTVGTLPGGFRVIEIDDAVTRLSIREPSTGRLNGDEVLGQPRRSQG